LQEEEGAVGFADRAFGISDAPGYPARERHHHLAESKRRYRIQFLSSRPQARPHAALMRQNSTVARSGR
jgi:hypothetical protein